MYTVGGLFSGVGGIELGFEKAGFKVVWANEKNKNACVTYKNNFNDRNLVEEDIHNIDPLNFRPVDVIVSGFPCQPFSVAGTQEGLADYRGNLFEHIIRFLKVVRPEVLFLENVKNLETHDSGRTFKIICDKLRNENYSIERIILNTRKYTSIPQNRERIFIICFKNEHKWWTRNPSLSITNYFKEILEEFKNQNINKKNHLFKSCLEKRKVEKKFYWDETSEIYKRNKFKEIINKKGLFYQYRRYYLRTNTTGMCPALTANMGTGGHNIPIIKDSFGIRNLTPRECFNLQGFPKSFKLPKNMANSHLYKQAGNSVTVPIVYKLALLVLQALKESKKILKRKNMLSNRRERA